MRADLHLHSVYSDGSYTPEAIARLARMRGVRLLSVTDHDTMAGAFRMRRAAEAEGLFCVDGIEVSANSECKVHITGYGCDPTGKAYAAFAAERREGCIARAREIAEKLAALGYPVTMEEIERERAYAESPLHSMHIARAVYRHGGFRDEYEVYATLLACGKPAHSDLLRPSPEEAIDAVHAMGGIACLAHPGRIRLDPSAREALIRRLHAHGLDGIECVYSTHTREETEYFRGIAAKLGLLVTGGSDTHIEDEKRRIGDPPFEPDNALWEALRPMTGAK